MPIPRPDTAQIQDLAAGNHFSVTRSDESAYAALFDRILDNFDQLADVDLEQPQRRYVRRSAGPILTPGENFGNALVRRCRIEGAAQGRLKAKRIALKDSIGIAGIPITCGSAVVEYRAAQDATIVTRMLEAGADIVAIANMDNMAFSGAGDTSFYGPVRNPHSAQHLAGGSSGGSAAALFSGDVDMSIGCDQAGSIRIPAAWCGVVGLKPTFGLVPYTGILGFDQSFDHTGPMAKSAEDTALLLDVIAGPDGLDPRQRSIPPNNYYEGLRGKRLDGLRVAVLREGFGGVGAQADVDEMVRTAAHALAGLGARVSEASLPMHLEAAPVIWGVFAEGVTATFQANGQGYHWSGTYDPGLNQAFGEGMQLRGDQLPMQCKFNLMLGTYMRQRWHGSFYAKAQTLRARLRKAYDELLAQYDVLVMPTTPMKAHAHAAGLNSEELVLAGWNMVANTAPFNMTGHPSLSVPCGFSEGLPVGMMLTGRHFEDGVLLSIANAYQQSQG